MALLAGAPSIRDVIAFPKAASGVDPLTGAPAPVDERQLKELGVQARGAARTRASLGQWPEPVRESAAYVEPNNTGMGVPSR